MELLLAFIVKFIGVIYGTIYGLLSSIPFIKEWIAVSKIAVSVRDGGIEMRTTGHGVLVIIDGHAVWNGGGMAIPRTVLRNQEAVTLAGAIAGEVRVWLKMVDVSTGKELTVTKHITANEISRAAGR